MVVNQIDEVFTFMELTFIEVKGTRRSNNCVGRSLGKGECFSEDELFKLRLEAAGGGGGQRNSRSREPPS